MVDPAARVLASALALTMTWASVPGSAHAAGPEEGAAPAEPAASTAAEVDTAPTDAQADPEPAPAAQPEPTAPPPDADAGTERAAAAYREGSDAYDLGKFASAAEKFGEAWELSHKTPLLFNLGQAHWKWFDLDPDITHLRQARLFFTNYDKRMRLSQDYDLAEIAGYLEQIEKQIEEQEKKIAEANRPVVINSAALTEEEVQQAQRRRTTRALNISGTTLIVIGAVAAGGGIAGLASRAVHGTVLDNTTGRGDAQVNLATADEDARRRNGYLLSGQIAFGALIAAVVILPIGITLRAIGAKRHKADGDKADGGDKPRKGRRRNKKARAHVIPGATRLTVRF